MDEESMEARSDFIAENTPNCDDCSKHDEGYDEGIAKRLQFHYNRIRETKCHIDGILATYSKDDVVINDIRKEFNKLWMFLIKEVETEDFKKCPCSPECKF